MATHTVFILMLVAAFLAWAASFSVHAMKERTYRRSQEVLERRRAQVLDAITRIELEKESGGLDAAAHRKQMKLLRGELARVIGQLRSAPKPHKETAAKIRKRPKTASKNQRA